MSTVVRKLHAVFITYKQGDLKKITCRSEQQNSRIQVTPLQTPGIYIARILALPLRKDYLTRTHTGHPLPSTTEVMPSSQRGRCYSNKRSAALLYISVIFFF